MNGASSCARRGIDDCGPRRPIPSLRRGLAVINARVSAEQRNREVHTPPISLYRWWARGPHALIGALLDAAVENGATCIADPSAAGAPSRSRRLGATWQSTHRVKWVAKESPAYGFDVLSYAGRSELGEPELPIAIEVKSTTLPERSVFQCFLTIHEWQTAQNSATATDCTSGAASTRAHHQPAAMADRV